MPGLPIRASARRRAAGFPFVCAVNTVGMDVEGTATGEGLRAGFEGEWVVRRVSGLLPPVGLRKRIGPRGGSTRFGRLPVALFRVRGRVLDYRWLPLEDELTFDGEAWVGRGVFLGREFCRFRLERPT